MRPEPYNTQKGKWCRVGDKPLKTLNPDSGGFSKGIKVYSVRAEWDKLKILFDHRQTK